MSAKNFKTTDKSQNKSWKLKFVEKIIEIVGIEVKEN
jgi:hypothetical protein